ncbi:MAG: hypothetical protein NWE93_03835 [Candidatus Bathyarchaeota archaeon]|nr:hypothetical protein [Candidatus Bathyarchaeota archaeon]
MSQKNILQLNLANVEQSLLDVQTNWKNIDDELARRKIGRRDTAFDGVVRGRMMAAYRHLDVQLRRGVEPFSQASIPEMLELNCLVHYGVDWDLRLEYHKAIMATSEKFYSQIIPLQKWYRKHMKGEPHPLKVAAEIYVAILGHPQLFIEGNHRTGSIISSWISMYHGRPPFVLSVDNAVAYFKPSAEIKKFADKATWRGRQRLPKYRRSFKEFWEANIDAKYVEGAKPKK